MNVDLRKALALRQLKEGVEVGIHAVNSPVGHQTDKVEGIPPLPGHAHPVEDRLVSIQLPGFHRLVDPHEILVHHPPGSDIQVADL